jgi:hypothetical protein
MIWYRCGEQGNGLREKAGIKSLECTFHQGKQRMLLIEVQSWGRNEAIFWCQTGPNHLHTFKTAGVELS